jgi:hypothetical protein
VAFDYHRVYISSLQTKTGAVNSTMLAMYKDYFNLENSKEQKTFDLKNMLKVVFGKNACRVGNSRDLCSE